MSVAWLCLGAVFAFAGLAAGQDDPKVAVVDVARIFKEYPRTRELDAKLDEARATYENEIDERMQGHHRLVEELARIDKASEKAALGAKERDDFQKRRETNLEETRKVEGDVKNFEADRERALREMTMRVRTQVVEDIMVVVNARVESQHYDLILNKSGQGAGGRFMVLYANGSIDITDDVIATLIKTHPAARVSVPAASP